MKNVLVSICCISYNQEQFIRDALEGFVMQKTDFPFEIVISDDCSKDGTRKIIEEYKAKYPELIRDISPNENMGSMQNFLYVQRSAKGKYIALCEGDDYWIDSLKLQKQVDFMEAHPDYSMCFTNTIVKFPDSEKIAINHLWDTYTLEDVISNNALNTENRGDFVVPCGHTSSILYRSPKEGLPDWISKCYIGDEPLFIALGQYGKAKFINEPMSVYRAGVGVSSRQYSYEKDWKSRVSMYRIINEGLNYRYRKNINPIIAELCYGIGKLLWKNKRKKEAIKYLLESLRYNMGIVIKWINNKI